MGADAALHELTTKGFVVVRSFFSEKDVSELVADFERGAPPSNYPHGFKLLRRDTLERTWPKLAPIVQRIRETTPIKVDVLPFITFSHFIVTEFTSRTSFWHQDFDFDYKLTRDHINYLNFYVPIAKPDPSRSNLMVVPFDALKERSEEAWQKLVNGGGHRLVVENGKTKVYGNYGDVIGKDDSCLYALDFDLDELAVTPSLSAGDLLLLRGDVIHRTQDAETARIAASIRVTYSQKTIRRDRIGTTDPEARDALAKLLSSLLNRLDALGRDEMTMEEFLSAGATRES